MSDDNSTPDPWDSGEKDESQDELDGWDDGNEEEHKEEKNYEESFDAEKDREANGDFDEGDKSEDAYRQRWGFDRGG